MYKLTFFACGLFFATTVNAQFSGIFKDLSTIVEDIKKSQSTQKSSEVAKSPSQPQTQSLNEKSPVEFPEELLGKYAVGSSKKSCSDSLRAEKLTDVWPGIVIKKDNTQAETIICSPKSIDFKDGKFITSEKCENMGEEWEENTSYQINGDNLIIKKNSELQSFVLCERPKVAVACSNDEHSVFEDTTGKKNMAICAHPKKPPFSRIQYRFGPKEGAELVYSADKKNGNKFYFASETLAPALSIEYFWFSIGKNNYAVIDCSGGGCGNGGIVVTKGEKVISKQKFIISNYGKSLNYSGLLSLDSNGKFVSESNLIEEKYFPNESAPASLYE